MDEFSCFSAVFDFEALTSLFLLQSLKLGKIKRFLAQALDSPSERAVENAIESLQLLDALDTMEDLTPLGHHLSNLPVDPKIGKIMLFGAMFSCLDPVLVIAAALSHKDPFVIPLVSLQSCSCHLAERGYLLKSLVFLFHSTNRKRQTWCGSRLREDL